MYSLIPNDSLPKTAELSRRSIREEWFSSSSSRIEDLTLHLSSVGLTDIL